MKDNNSLYGKHYKFQDNSLATSVTEITQKIAVIMNDNLENAIVDKIIQEANQEGVTDLFLLNKQAIMEAIKKQIPRKFEVWNGSCCCPTCNKLFGSYTQLKTLIHWEMPYCKFCGQALDWSDKNER